MLTVLLISAASAVLRPDATIDLGGRDIRVADVASLAGVGGRARARLAERVMARLPEGRERITLSRAALAALVRRSLPGIDVDGGDGGAVTLRRAANASPPVPDQSCFALANPVAAGDPVAADDAAPAPCARPSPALAFDRRSHSVRATADLAAGTPLGRISLPAAPGAVTGDRLTLVATVGPVRIRRGVVALQAGRAGGRLFVRTEDGEILAASLPETGQ